MLADPGVNPVTTPRVLTVALAVLLLLHVPPGLVSDSVSVEPEQTDEGPAMDAGV